MRIARLVGVVIALACLGSLPVCASRADYAGDVEPTFVRFVGPEGAAKELTPGSWLAVEYTITNTEKKPLLITGVDSQVRPSACTEDVKRATPKLNPNGVFPIYLEPGETSKVLLDEKFTLTAESRCKTVTLRWFPNATADIATARPATPTPTPKVTPSEPEVADTPAPKSESRSLRNLPLPFVILSGVAIAAVGTAFVIIFLSKRAPRGRRSL